MGPEQAFDSNYSEPLRSVPLLVDAVVALSRDCKMLAAMLVGTTATAYRSTGFGYSPRSSSDSPSGDENRAI